ncbi:MAG: DUF6079 family protein [Bacillota bacterium]
MKIKNIVELKSFEPVINLKWADNVNAQEHLLNNYIMTEDLAELFGNILETINMIRFEDKREELGSLDKDTLRSHIISGQYGTGKSYFLLMLSIILELKDEKVAEELLNKFNDFPELSYQLKNIIDKKDYLVVRINGENENEKRFSDVIQESVIERLEKEFDDVLLKSNYQNLLENLEEHKGHMKRKELLEDVLFNKSYDYEDLVSGLKGHQRDAKRKYEAVLKEAGLNAGESFKSLDEFIRDVDDYLSTKGYDDLIIILDEFSAYVDASIEDKRINTDLSNIQDLAQLTSPTSGLDISFITSTHVDMSNVLEKTLSNQEAIEKVLGRFKQHTIAFEQGNKLIKNTIKVNKTKFNDLRQNHLEKITKLEDKYNISLEDYYPLHPAALLYIKPVADNFAQKDRTLFAFLKEVVKEKYHNQSIEKNDKLNLIQLDDIFDYFFQSFKRKDKSLVKAYNQLKQISNNNLQEKISKSLVVSYASLLSTTAEGAGLSVDDLKWIYLIEDDNKVVEAINNLANNKRSPVVANGEKYELIVSGETVNIEQKLKEESQEVNPYQQLKELLDDFSDLIEIKRNYEISYSQGVFPVDRELDGSFVSVAELRNNKLDRHFRTNKEGKVVFVIPKFNEEYHLDALENNYKEKMKDLSANKSLALPKKMYFDEKDLKKYGAIKKLENDQDIVENEDLRKLLAKRKRSIEGRVKNRQLRNFGKINNFEFVFNNEIVEKEYKRDIDLFKGLLHRYYYKFPFEIETENVNTRTASNPVIDHLIIPGERIISKDSSSVFQKQVFYTMEPLDLITKEEQPDNYKVKIKAPRNENSEKSYQIWDIITAEDLSLADKFNKLMSSPYGLNEPLIEIYIALAIGLGKFRLRKKEGQVITNPGKDHIANINSSDYILEKVPDTDVEKKEHVKGIWQVFTNLIPNSECEKFDPRGKWRDTKVVGVLGKELKTAIDMLDTYKSGLESLQLDSQLIKDLINNLEKVINSRSPEKLYDNLINLLNDVFSNDNYDANLKELEDLISNLKKFINNKKSEVSEIKNKIEKLNRRISVLDDYSKLKDRLKDINSIWNTYKSNPFNYNLLSDLKSKIKKLIAAYNQTYKEAHDKYYDKYEQIKDEILEDEHLDIVKKLEKIKISEITNIEQHISNFTNVNKCNCLNITENNVASCSCELKNLKITERKLKKIKGSSKNKIKKIKNIYIRYIEKLNEMREEISEYIEKRDPSLQSNWEYVLKSINSNPLKNKEKFINDLDKIVDIVNDYLNDEDGPNPNNNFADVKKFIDKLKTNIKTHGLKEFPFERLEKIFKETCDELRNKYEGLENKE